MDNMTALVSCFARAYHCRNSNSHAFEDPVAEQMLTAEEYDAISRNMTQGIQYFAPDFQGTQGMKAKYSYEEMEALLSNAGFLIYEHIDAGEATDAFLKESGMTAPTGVGYCPAVRKG